MEQVIEELNQKLPGWMRYFQLAECKRLTENLDGWIRHKLRCYRIKQMKRATTIARILQREGTDPGQAWSIAKSSKGWWPRAGTITANAALNKEWFKRKKLVSLRECYQSL